MDHDPRHVRPFGGEYASATNSSLPLTHTGCTCHRRLTANAAAMLLAAGVALAGSVQAAPVAAKSTTLQPMAAKPTVAEATTVTRQATTQVASPAAEPAMAAPAAAEPAAAEPAAEAAAAAVPGVAATQQLDQMTVTGTAIPKADSETAVPVTVYHADQLRREGITSVDQLMQRLSVNSSSSGNGLGSGTFGNYTGGTSSPNLRGLGASKTLVLLNGRRIANSAFTGESVDLNMIPFNAIERIEILRDGASALYGTDAIGGVINFITKQNLQGGNLEVQQSTPTHSGGGQQQGYTGSWGYGDLNKDGFNLMGILNYQKQHALSMRSRQFYDALHNRYLSPREVISEHNSPANFEQSGHLAAAGSGCNGIPLNGGCGWDGRKVGNYQNPRENTALYSVGTFKINDTTTGALSYFWARSKVREIDGPYAPRLSVAPDSPYYPGNRQGPERPSWLDASRPVSAEYLARPLGTSDQLDTNDQKRVMFNLTGEAAGWRYDSAVAYNISRFHQRFSGSFLNDSVLQRELNDGQFNPFRHPTAGDLRALHKARVNGTSWVAKGEVYTLDGHAYHSLGNWFGAGPVEIALGGEARHERYSNTVRDRVGGIERSGLDPAGNISARRDVQGVFSQVDIPLLESLELTGALRYDHYSQVGHTLNPKVSFRYQPLNALIIRGAYGRGFQAPSLSDLYSPASMTYGASGNDPLYCANGTASAGRDPSKVCDVSFRQRNGGNRQLRPVKAKNYSLGFVFEPITGLETTVDFWWVKISNDIDNEPTDYILRHDQAAIRRDSDGYIDYLDSPSRNIASTKTHGVDIGQNYTFNTPIGTWNLALNGTYVSDYRTRNNSASPWRNEVGYMTGRVPRWKHSATVSWKHEGWDASISNSFFSKMHDYWDRVSSPRHKRVNSFTSWDLQGGYSFANGLKINVGALNIFNRHPPFNEYDGTDPRFYDVVGRSLYTDINFRF